MKRSRLDETTEWVVCNMGRPSKGLERWGDKIEVRVPQQQRDRVKKDKEGASMPVTSCCTPRLLATA